MPIRLNDTKITATKIKGKRYELRDAVVRGLYIEVGAKGGKVWWVQVSRGKKRERHRLGPFPALKTVDARNQAMAMKEDIVRPKGASDIKTVGELFERYKSAHENKRRSWRDTQSVWDNWAENRLGHIRLTDVTHHHGLDLRDFVTLKSSEARAAKVLIYLRPMFSWAAKERIVDANPWTGIATGGLPQARDRVLSLKEWQAVWDASFYEPYPFGPFIRTLMLSGQRLSNVAQMRWDEIHDGIWIIPREKFKATRPEKAKAHEVPLSIELKRLLQNIPNTGDYIFSARAGKPIVPGSRQKERIAKSSNVQSWTFHDLRRSAATRMAEGKTTRFIIERALGHADVGVTATYDRATYRAEKLEAFEILASSLKIDTLKNVVGLSI